METWRGLEDVVRLNLTRSIGVSNFNKEQMERLLKEASIKPTVLQIEVLITVDINYKQYNIFFPEDVS